MGNNGVVSIGVGKKGSEKTIIQNAHSEFSFDEKIISTDDFANHEIKKGNDDDTFDIVHTSHPEFKGSVTQRFVFDKDDKYLTVQVIVNSESNVSTNYISVLSVYKNSLLIDNGVFLKIPFEQMTAN